MDCDTCLKFQSDLRREAETEARAILTTWNADPLQQDAAPAKNDNVIHASRQRRLQLTAALERHKRETHAVAEDALAR